MERYPIAIITWYEASAKVLRVIPLTLPDKVMYVIRFRIVPWPKIRVIDQAKG